MQITRDQQKKRNLNFFRSKIKEFEYYLGETIDCCDQSIAIYKSSKEDAGNRIVYSFSAFSNTVQALKDNASSFLDNKITWTEIAKLRHGEFMWLSRNAATHDGNPIVTGWAEGHYFVPADIYRLGQKGEHIKIAVPTVDVRQFCLEFSRDFCDLLFNKINELESVKITSFTIDEIEQALKSPFVPDFARQLFEDNKSELFNSISEAKFDPREDSLSTLLRVGKYCDEHLAKNEQQVPIAAH